MWRRLGVGVSVLAILYASWAAPYTHAHRSIDSDGDDDHTHGRAVVHTHVTAHAHHDKDASRQPYADENAERVWSADLFVFQPPVPSHPPSPVLLVFYALHVELTSIWLAADRLQPRAHGPPAASPTALRGPPAFLPLFF